jgi:hypothetical protein
MTEQAESPDEVSDHVSDGSFEGAGSVADDLAKLWSTLAGVVGEAHTALNAAAPGCNGWSACPLCRLRSLVEHCPSDVTEHISAAARSIALALAAAVAPPARSTATPGFERIDLTGDADSVESAE